MKNYCFNICDIIYFYYKKNSFKLFRAPVRFDSNFDSINTISNRIKA